MDSTEFRKDLIKYINETYDEFCKYQRVTLDTLAEFDRICQNNYFNYYLAYGTMLGAIRDSEQIPWDYDIDTFVKIEDKSRLLQLLNEQLGPDYYYEYSDKNNTYPAPCLRICKKGFNVMAIHVDVFFLIGTPNDEEKRKKFVKKTEKIIHLRSSKYLSLYLNEESSNKIQFLYGKVLSVFYNMIPAWYLKRQEREIQKKYPTDSSDYLYPYQEVYKKVYPKKIFDSMLRIKMGGYQFNVPSGFEEFLKINYGDWKSYLPIKNRFEEFYKMKNIVDERQELYEQQQPRQ